MHHSALLIVILSAALLGGCATVTQSSTQTLHVLVLDAQDRPVRGLNCRAANVVSEVEFATPATEIVVRRGSADLEIECRRSTDAPIAAMATVVPRREGLEQALVPFGSVAVALDHLTGKMYNYPTMIRMRLGKHLRFEFSDEARATAEVATIGETVVADTNARGAARVPLPANAATRRVTITSKPITPRVPSPAAAGAAASTESKPAKPDTDATESKPLRHPTRM